MSSKLTTLAGSGLSALALMSAMSPADARMHQKARHTAHKAKVSAGSSSTAQEINELKGQVEALTARLEAQEAAQRITADQASTAAASADAASASVKTELAANSKAAAAQIKSAISAAAPKPNWTNDTTVTGRMFFDISNINQNNGAGKVVPSGTGFDIKRLYLGVNHTFSKEITSGFVIDAQAAGVANGTAAQPGSTSTRLNGANFYVKNAWLQYKFNDALVLRAGASDMPWIPFAEGVYGNRYIENVVSERVGIGTSADWGLHLSGLVGNPKSFNVTYAASVVNGAGYRSPNRSNSVDLEGRIALNYMGAVAAIGGYTGKLGADVQNVVTTPTTAPIRTAKRFNALLGYVDKRIRVGTEYYYAKDFSQAMVLGAAENVSWGLSNYAQLYFTPKFSVFGRYDQVKPSDYLAPHRYEVYYNLGLTYTPAKIVDISLVYKRDQVKTNNAAFAPGTLSTSNGTIGTTIVGGQGTYDELGIFGQWRF